MGDLLERARAGDERAFAELVEPHRHELAVHCYRILGSADDADDTVQETMLAAWRGLAGFEGRASLRTWLYTIATHASLRLARRRPPRMLSWDVSPARDPLGDLGAPLTDAAWLDPWVEAVDPAEAYATREAIGLAYVAALQQLPANQRAVLVLRDVLDFSAAETAELLETSVGSVTSALQRARAAMARGPLEARSRSTNAPTGAVESFVDAFEAGDVDAVVRLLAKDVRFTMPPLPAWFDGIDDVGDFFRHRSLTTPWRVKRRLLANGAPAILAEQQRDGVWAPSALMVLHVAGEHIAWIASFLDLATIRRADR